MTAHPWICVYCGSRPGSDPAFAELARAVGQAIAARGWGLVYGAGDMGLMGLTARAAQEGGAPVIGFIPRRLMAKERPNHDLTATVVTETMHERKKLMMENADAVLALPGGIGTLDELVEAITWRQLGITERPIVLLDGFGYWSSFRALIDTVIENGFADPGLAQEFAVAETVEDAMTLLGERLVKR
ncbi:MAG: TIGR00730 family Rossman fold protein [Paracoccaceae bacterium]